MKLLITYALFVIICFYVVVHAEKYIVYTHLGDFSHDGDFNSIQELIGLRDDCQIKDTFKIGNLEGVIVESNSPDSCRVNNDDVEIVEDGKMYAFTTWGIDRINQRDLPLDNNFDTNTPSEGSNIFVYVMDTGIDITHSQFGGRVEHGVDYIDGTFDTCQFHGTHVAGTIGSNDYGVANNVTLIDVRILGCNGGGTWSNFILALSWISNDCITRNGQCLVNISLGGRKNNVVDDAINALRTQGIVPVCAAGNNNGRTCEISPARATGCIAVGASDVFDIRASFSNYGKCTDIFAPGVDILSTIPNENMASYSGTSMATPHVVGVLAVMWSENINQSADDINIKLISQATDGRLSNLPVQTPNDLLFLKPQSINIEPVNRNCIWVGDVQNIQGGFNCNNMTDEEIDIRLHNACNNTYPGSHAATGEELQNYQNIINHSQYPIWPTIPSCPGCNGCNNNGRYSLEDYNWDSNSWRLHENKTIISAICLSCIDDNCNNNK